MVEAEMLGLYESYFQLFLSLEVRAPIDRSAARANAHRAAKAELGRVGARHRDVRAFIADTMQPSAGIENSELGIVNEGNNNGGVAKAPRKRRVKKDV